MNKFLVSSVLLAGTTLASISLISPQVEAEGQAVVETALETIIIKSSSVGANIVLGGSILPLKTVNLSAQLPGDVQFIGGQEGDAFKKGDRLVALDTAALMAKKRQALSQLNSAEAGYRNAMVQYNREILSPNSQSNTMLGGAPSMFSMFSDPFRSMTGQGNPSYERHSNLYGQNVQVLTAKNAIEQAKAGLKELDESIKNATSYAPFDGVIVKKMVEQGDIVQPGMPLVSFADLTQLQLQVEVPSNLISMLSTGASMQARLDGSDALINVTVDRIYPSADAGGHTTTVKFKLAEGTTARSGMYAEVLIPDLRKKGFENPIIPQSAILWRGSLPAVYQVTESGQLKLRLLRIGEKTSTGEIIVISGIKAGDKILANPAANTRSGS